jgi:hypothetical protein
MDSICESLRKKIIGKPYSGKPNVRFDEGELEIEPTGHYASSLLYCRNDSEKWPASGAPFPHLREPFLFIFP